MTTLITGCTGLLGNELIPLLQKQGKKIYGLSRNPQNSNCSAIKGDILKYDLGIKEVPADISEIYHLAALINLSSSKHKEVWKTNYIGTKNVLAFCRKHKIKRLYYCSTAYTDGRNPYEFSKACAEEEVSYARFWLDAFIFKPSIIVGSVGGAYQQFIWLMVNVHRRAELIRRKIEGALRLPVIEPIFRIQGDPEARLNLIPANVVAEAIANTENPGTYWITNREAPKLKELGEWIGEIVMLRMKFLKKFKMTPIEALFHKLALPFLPYLQEIYLPSDLKCFPKVDKEFIQENLKYFLKISL